MRCRKSIHIRKMKDSQALRKKCPYSELFCSAYSRIRTEYGEIQSISPYSVGMQENTDKNNSEYGHFSHIEEDNVCGAVV